MVLQLRICTHALTSYAKLAAIDGSLFIYPTAYVSMGYGAAIPCRTCACMVHMKSSAGLGWGLAYLFKERRNSGTDNECSRVLRRTHCTVRVSCGFLAWLACWAPFRNGIGDLFNCRLMSLSQILPVCFYAFFGLGWCLM